MMSISDYVQKMKIVQQNLLRFIDEMSNEEENFQNLLQHFEDYQMKINKHCLKTVLYMLVNISKNHFRCKNFFEKIETIIQYYINEIKLNFTNYEIFKIFRSNKRLLLYLINVKIIILDIRMINELMTSKFISANYLIYLLPEQSMKIGLINQIDVNYKEKRKIGENDDIVCQIIRQDLIEEFIIYVKRNNFSLNNNIKKSIYETNALLLKQEQTTLIEYAAFYGSIQIFKYLYKNDVLLTSSLWVYAVHGENEEIINILDENNIQPPKYSYEICINECIKCHHNSIVNYIINNLSKNIYMKSNQKDLNENIYSNCFHYYNFSFFPDDIEDSNILNYACKYDYYQIVEYYLKTRSIDMKTKIISNFKFLFSL